MVFECSTEDINRGKPKLLANRRNALFLEQRPCKLHSFTVSVCNQANAVFAFELPFKVKLAVRKLLFQILKLNR